MRGVGVVEYVVEDSPPQDGRVVGGYDDDDDSPSVREVPPAKSLRRRAKVLLPKFASRRRRFVPKVLSLFFLGQNDLLLGT